MANEEHLLIFKGGVSNWNTWRSWNRGIKADLAGADLRGNSLVEVDLRMADASRADLSGIDLRGAHLGGADLHTANLTDANLKGADLFRTNLNRANLSYARLIYADLIGTELNGADLSYSEMWLTALSNIDLSGVKGLETVHHLGPSTIGIDTINRSKGKIPKAFLERAGVPKTFVDYMESFRWEGGLPSCFICHSVKDEGFALRLLKDLQDRDVPCWFFKEHATWGEPVWSEIDRATNTYDKLLVLCSEDSLQSIPVLREIERALQREDREKKNILFPVRLNDYLFEKWEHPRKADILSKVVGDFRGYEDRNIYDRALAKLISALNKPQNKGGD